MQCLRNWNHASIRALFALVIASGSGCRNSASNTPADVGTDTVTDSDADKDVYTDNDADSDAEMNVDEDRDADSAADTDRKADDQQVPSGVVVDFSGVLFPPVVHKLGYNGQWNEVDKADLEAATAAGEASAPMAAGLIELNQKPAGVLATTPLFVKQNSEIVAIDDPELEQLRSASKSAGMLNLIQLAGTPDLIPVDPRLTEPSNGNWYPLPNTGDLGSLAHAFGDLARVLGEGPTLYCFWQEPDHTIGANLSSLQSLGLYLDFYTLAAPAVRASRRDVVIAAAQQNASAGLNPNGQIDGAGYAVFANLFLDREAQLGFRLPLDYISIQNYKAKSSTPIIGNARIAYRNPRFANAPLLMNEWNFDKNSPFAELYGTGKGVTQMLELLSVIVDAPDVSYALLPRNVFSQKTLAYHALKLLAALGTSRRPIRLDGPGAEGLSGIAAGSDGGGSVLLWNKDTTPRTIDLELRGITALTRLTTVAIQTIDGAPPQSGSMTLNSGERVNGLAIPGYGVVLVQAGTAAVAPKLKRATYTRHAVLVERTGDASAPRGMGFYDFRRDALVAATAGVGGTGLAGVVFRAVPDGYTMSALVDSTLTTSTNANAVVGTRIDYLDGDQVLHSVFVRDPGFSGADPWSNVSTWPSPVTQENLSAAFTHRNKVTLTIGAGAPSGWSTADGGARRVMVSLIVTGFYDPLIVELVLGDDP